MSGNLYIFAIRDMKRVLSIAISRAAAALLAVSAVVSCMKPFEYGDGFGFIDPVEGTSDRPVRTPTDLKRNVLLLYSAGHTTGIPKYLKEDIDDLKTGWLPDGVGFSNDVVLVYTHLPKNVSGYSWDYSSYNSPVLYRLYAGEDGTVVSDTLCVYPPETVSASAQQLNEVLSYVHEMFPAKGYGMIFSSHASGYLPNTFYNDPGNYIYMESPAGRQTLSVSRPDVPQPVWMREGPMVKSLGYDYFRPGDYVATYEMDLKDFAAAIPMKLDYLLFDACLMGGIEVAYELKGKCGKVGFSQAEVLAEGFDYKTLTSHLLGENPYPQGVCEDYFQQYDILYGNERSATVSLVDCDQLEPLAAVCRELFAKYRNSMNALRAGRVQRYYRYDCHWFYDLYDMVAVAGADSSELARLQEALDLCVDYKAATPEFLPYSYGFSIDVFSGFSMYMPADGNVELDKYYRTLQWNKATLLVE